MTMAVPRGLGRLDGAEDAIAREIDIARHVVAVISLRALSPAERLRVLMMAAATVLAANTRADEREVGCAFVGRLLAAAVCGAGHAVDEFLANVPAEGSA